MAASSATAARAALATVGHHFAGAAHIFGEDVHQAAATLAVRALPAIPRPGAWRTVGAATIARVGGPTTATTRAAAAQRDNVLGGQVRVDAAGAVGTAAAVARIRVIARAAAATAAPAPALFAETNI